MATMYNVIIIKTPLPSSRLFFYVYISNVYLNKYRVFTSPEILMIAGSVGRRRVEMNFLSRYSFAVCRRISSVPNTGFSIVVYRRASESNCGVANRPRSQRVLVEDDQSKNTFKKKKRTIQSFLGSFWFVSYGATSRSSKCTRFGVRHSECKPTGFDPKTTVMFNDMLINTNLFDKTGIVKARRIRAKRVIFSVAIEIVVSVVRTKRNGRTFIVDVTHSTESKIRVTNTLNILVRWRTHRRSCRAVIRYGTRTTSTRIADAENVPENDGAATTAAITGRLVSICVRTRELRENQNSRRSKCGAIGIRLRFNGPKE